MTQLDAWLPRNFKVEFGRIDKLRLGIKLYLESKVPERIQILQTSQNLCGKTRSWGHAIMPSCFWCVQPAGRCKRIQKGPMHAIDVPEIFEKRWSEESG